MVDAVRRHPPSLLVFSDDWGRHPSSCQHLIRELLPQRHVTWVNTIGTRTPKLDAETFRRAWGKLAHWLPGRRQASAVARLNNVTDTAQHNGVTLAGSQGSHAEPTVLNPRMWPWFTRRIDRAVNRRLLERQLRSAVEAMPQPVVALTTLPITADLVGRLPVQAWVYYCVDDFREWPGLDGRTLGRMEEDLVRKADDIIVVSETLKQRMRELGRESHLLTHGCNLDFFSNRAPLAPPLRKGGQGGSGGVAQAAPIAHSPRPRLGGGEGPVVRGPSDEGSPLTPSPNEQPAPLTPTLTPRKAKGRGSQEAHPHLHNLESPLLLFWGVIDRRMDTAFLRELSASMQRGAILLVGPQQNPDPELLSIPRLVTRPAVPMSDLPELAAAAQVLIMPYADLPVTRAMQPLKLKEYLATGKPAVVRNLPAVADWSDALDAVATPQQFAERVHLRLLTELPESQRIARERLREESWSTKAAQLETWLSDVATRTSAGETRTTSAPGLAAAATQTHAFSEGRA